MQDKFKQYLEGEFRKIAPTPASRDYRISLYHQLTDYVQELKLKGIDNDDIIFDLAIKSLGNMDENLAQFEQNQKAKKVASAKKTATIVSVSSTLGLGLILMLAVGLFVKIQNISGFSFSWIFMLLGAFSAITAVLLINMHENTSKYKAIIERVSVYAITTLWVVFITLTLLAINIAIPREPKTIEGWWLGFIVIPAALAVADAIIALATNQKGKWINLSIDLILVSVMLYVIIGLLLGPILDLTNKFWAFGWTLILGGIAGAGIILGLAKKSKDKKDKLIFGDSNEVDEKYYTEW